MALFFQLTVVYLLALAVVVWVVKLLWPISQVSLVFRLFIMVVMVVMEALQPPAVVAVPPCMDFLVRTGEMQGDSSLMVLPSMEEVVAVSLVLVTPLPVLVATVFLWMVNPKPSAVLLMKVLEVVKAF
jgi:hypothetical protein